MVATMASRRVYSAEQLQRLRGTQSQPKLREAIEEHDSEDADVVKEHVLRGSKSFAARSLRSRTSGPNSLRVPSSRSNHENIPNNSNEAPYLSARDTNATGRVLGEISSNGQVLRQVPHRLRPSPTPSLKRKKAEALVKNHGSPQHVRVTAGGRIVPSEQSPLTYPRYGYSAVKVNGGVVKFAPNLHGGHELRDYATQEDCIAQDEEGNFVQIIDGIVKPIRIINGKYQLERNPPNVIDDYTRKGLSAASIDRRSNQSADNPSLMATQDPRFAEPEPSEGSQITALELEYSKLDHESKELDKTEALHSKTMNKFSLNALHCRRRELVKGMNTLRISLKNLKTQPPPNAPKSPRAMAPRQSMSPQSNCILPLANMQQQHGNDVPVLPCSPYLGAPLLPRAGHFAPMSSQPLHDVYGTHPWCIAPPNIYMHPQPFDGSASNAYASYTLPLNLCAAGEQPAYKFAAASTTVEPEDAAVASRELRRDSIKASQAIAIRVPDKKRISGAKSSLNPMSPVYKPSGLSHAQPDSIPMNSVKDRAPTPLSPVCELQPESQTRNRPTDQSDETISPVKKNAHLQSSSISSFDTADFFPRNTREYSTRQLAYPVRVEALEDTGNLYHCPKRNESPTTLLGHEHHDSNWNPTIPAEAFACRAPEAGNRGTTAVSPDISAQQQRVTLAADDKTRFEKDMLPSRDIHNMSPKSKRQYLTVEEDPQLLSALPISSSNNGSVAGDPIAILDFSSKSPEWIQGYQAGLRRRPVAAEHVEDFLDGYCSGILKSKASTRRPLRQNATSSSSSKTTSSGRNASTTLPVLESMHQNIDSLKEAVFSPQNESTILSPSGDETISNEASYNLGAWEKSHPRQAATVSGFPLRQRTSSMLQRQGIPPEDREDGKLERRDSHHIAETTSQSGRAEAQSGNANISQRVTSLTSIDSAFSRPFPINQAITSGMSRKSSTFVAQSLGLANGYFASAQFDGSPQVQQSLRMTSDPMSLASRSKFHEVSLDGMSSPPRSPLLSPSVVASPPLSPTSTSNRSKKGGSHANTPIKGPSPAKAKFEHIAEKVGIKVNTSAATGNNNSSTTEPSSPNSKRRWRDVWRGGRGKENSE